MSATQHGPTRSGPLGNLRWQVAGVLVATGALAALHWSNDGLWFQGDAPRHAANGLFFWDWLMSEPTQPLAFALSYYARYPVITPLAYPPLFYLVEAAAFWLIAPSPYVAKSLVLGCSAVAGLYTMGLGRRFGGALSGWAGVCTVLLPGFVLYSNAVMLNIPGTALAVGALYHLVQFLQSARARHGTLATILALAAVMTYYAAAVVLPLAVVWIVLSPRRKWLAFGWLVPLLLAAALVITAAVLPEYWQRNAPSAGRLVDPANWAFYGREIIRLIGWPWLLLAAIALTWTIAVGFRRSSAVSLAVAWPTVVGALVLLPAYSDRYALMLVPIAVLAVFLGLEHAAALAGRWRPIVAGVGVAGLLALAGTSAVTTRVPVVSGFDEIAAFLGTTGPNDTVLYSGLHDGVFGFYVRARDPRFERRLQLANKLLARYELTPQFLWVETPYVESPDEVVELIRRNCGCRWIAVEGAADSSLTTVDRYLRKAVTGPEFEHVRSFPVRAHGVARVDLFRFLLPLDPPPPIDLVFPSFSARVFPGVEPIRSRR